MYFVFVFSSVDVDTGKRISINANNADIKDVIDQILQGQKGLTYVVNNKTIVVKQEVAEPEQQQRTTVKGKILDATGMPVIGAAIKELGTTNGTITDLDGNFTLTIESPESMLEVSYVGFQTQTLKAQSGKPLAITLQEDTQSLDEVVVVGYGTQKKVNLTGAITSVKSDMLENRTTSSAVNIITGQMAGVTVVQSNGQPGFDTGSLRVRGVGTMGDADAMVVVDGVESSLDVVDPNDIETITVLKDAAAASIYGSKAAAGVILITTKRGSQTDLSISYNGEFGWEIPTEQPQMVGVTRYLEMHNELLYNDNGGSFYQQWSADQIKNWVKNNATDPDNYPITDWNDLILKKSAPRMTHTVSVNGGNDVVRSQATISYDEVSALYDGRKFQRYMLRSNNDFTIIKDLLYATLQCPQGEEQEAGL